MRPDTCQVTEDVRSAERPFFVRRRASAEQFYGAKLAIKKNKKRGGGEISGRSAEASGRMRLPTADAVRIYDLACKSVRRFAYYTEIFKRNQIIIQRMRADSGRHKWQLEARPTIKATPFDRLLMNIHRVPPGGLGNF